MPVETIGVLGSGDVGKTLAAGFASRDYAVTLGTGRPDDLADWLEDTDMDVTVGSFEDAARDADLVVLAVRGSAAADVIEAAGPGTIGEAVVLDTTNPLDFSRDGPPGLLFGGRDSLGERNQDALPEASVVKCFNTVSHTQMVDPSFAAETPPMFVCGDDADAKAQIEAVVTAFGWPGTLDVGPITAARYLEAIVPLWVILGTKLGTWDHAFAVVE